MNNFKYLINRKGNKKQYLKKNKIILKGRIIKQNNKPNIMIQFSAKLDRNSYSLSIKSKY